MSEALLKIRGYHTALTLEKELRQRIFVPPPKLSVSEWADAYRMLTSIASAEPGKWRTDRAPYQRGILDAFSDPLIDTVSVMSSAQVGKTEIVLNVIGYFMDQDPAPILCLQPTLEMARAFSKDRLKEMLRATPKLRGKIRDSGGRRDSDDTILHKQFAGGHITMVGANSASSLAARPIRVVLDDEIDRYPPSAGDEGDPVSLAKKRTLTFWNRKEGRFSTPTVKGASRIEASFEDGDQRRYHVPCPHCRAMQHLRWEHIDFDTASYRCESCACLIDETQKPGMLAAGQWVAAKPGGRHASFHLNALYSPWVTWRELIVEFQTAKHGGNELLRVFVNTVLGETWQLDGEGVDPDSLEARREVYNAEIPAGVGVLVASIDVQGDRLELAVKGYGIGQESWLIAHHRLYGNPRQPGDAVWDRADALLRKAYSHESGATMSISAVCIDSGDGQSVQAVYHFVRPRQKLGVFATKGYSIRGKPIVNRAGRKNKYGVKVIPIGTDTAKDLLFARLQQNEPGHPGYMHLPKTVDAEYLAQFGAEKVFIRYVKGVPVREYRQTRDRNEAIDLEVLCLAALHLLGAGVYDQLGTWVAKVQTEGARAKQAPPPVERPPDSVQMPAPVVPRPSFRMGGGYLNKWRR